MSTFQGNAPDPYLGFSEADFFWLVGWLEGEGSFHAGQYDSGFHIQVKVKCVDEDTCRRAQEIVGGSLRGPYPRPSPWQPIWVWSISSRAACTSLMRALCPHMSARRQRQIDHALALDRESPTRRPERRHGTRTMYNSGRCRCGACRAANAARGREERARAVA